MSFLFSFLFKFSDSAKLLKKKKSIVRPRASLGFVGNSLVKNLAGHSLKRERVPSGVTVTVTVAIPDV